MKEFEPKILGFLCNWCAYAGADLAGVSRNQYPPNLRVIRVMCSGRVDPVLIFDSFKKGIDGVAVLGCHHGDCHYQTGNYEAENKMNMTKKILEKVGISSDRLYLDWVSAAEGKRFSEVITNFTNQIKDVGPISKNKDFADKAIIGKKIAESTTIRWLIGKQRELTEFGNVYNEKINNKKMQDIIQKNISKQYDKVQIITHIKDKPKTIESISQKLKIPKNLVLNYLTSMEETGIVKLYDFKQNKPRYQVINSEEGLI